MTPVRSEMRLQVFQWLKLAPSLAPQASTTDWPHSYWVWPFLTRWPRRSKFQLAWM